MFRSFGDFMGGVVCLKNILLANFAKTLRSNRRKINSDHQRTQRLIRTDVGCRLLAPNVLFTGGQRQHEAGSTGIVLAHTDEPARHLPDVSFACCQKTDVGSSETERHSERLSFTYYDVGDPLFGRVFAGSFQDAESDR